MEMQRFTDEDLPELSANHRKWVLGAFVLFAIITLFIGSLAIAHGFFGETAQKRQAALEQLKAQGFDFSLLLSQNEAQRVELLEQKRTDTDGDGLTDYDEIHVYGTSMYIADTDSDGVSDFDELSSNKDPNCNENRINCYFPPVDADDEQEDAALPVEQTTEQVNESLRNAINKELAGAVTVGDFRTLLIQSGFSAEAVAALRDEDIEVLRNSILAPGNLFTNIENVDQSLTTFDILSSDPAEVRGILSGFGIPNETLSILSDEDLLNVYVETIREIGRVDVAPNIISGESLENELGL